ncbi:MAG TPA: DUF5777 family beta-barrel protein [Cytophagaceae bacterium]|nr:DUF5777 family beta-barrel protein [Cytophagaceae bacterium]
MKKFSIFFFIIGLYIGSPTGYAQQDSLMNMLDDSLAKAKKEPVISAFMGTHIINGQSVENPGKKILQFYIGHRFDAFGANSNNIIYNFFGLDAATIRIGFDYGITDRLTAGVGRSSLQKTYDNFLKYKLLRQTQAGMPITIVVYTNMAIATADQSNDNRTIKFEDRLTYTNQLLIARKFNKKLSIQLSPTHIHRNVVPTPQNQNDVFAMGFGGRYKILKRVSFNAEYFYLLPGNTATSFSNSFAAGFDIETGGHVFNLHFTNSPGLTESQFIPQTSGNWKKTLRFGFNISRVFSLRKK